MAIALLAALTAVTCGDDLSPGPGSGGAASLGGGGTGPSGPTGGGGTVADGGGGGAPPCGGNCSGDTPLCDETKMECVACLDHDNCSDADSAKCDDGVCVACDDSTQCVGVTDLGLCEAGTCVECNVDDATACGGGETCDLLGNACVDVAADSVANCEVCSNDAQCESGHRCIAMDYDGTPYGHYCLKEQPGCAQPFASTINKPSLNGDTAVNYCGIDQDLATCQAVLALLNNWRCSGTDGMCSPEWHRARGTRNRRVVPSSERSIRSLHLCMCTTESVSPSGPWQHVRRRWHTANVVRRMREKSLMALAFGAGPVVNCGSDFTD